MNIIPKRITVSGNSPFSIEVGPETHKRGDYRVNCFDKLFPIFNLNNQGILY